MHDPLAALTWVSDGNPLRRLLVTSKAVEFGMYFVGHDNSLLSNN